MAALLIAGAALGLAAYGAYQQYEGAEAQYAAQQRVTAAEMRNEEVRRKAMELEAKRRTMETIRNQQRARSIALSNANAQGAIMGSGLQGGYGQISGMTGDVLQGIFGNLALGNQTFANNQAISLGRLDMAAAQTQMSQGQGLSSLGGSIINVLPQTAALTAGFGSSYRSPVAASSTSFG